jgi:hypothetical protein
MSGTDYDSQKGSCEVTRLGHLALERSTWLLLDVHVMGTLGVLLQSKAQQLIPMGRPLLIPLLVTDFVPPVVGLRRLPLALAFAHRSDVGSGTDTLR